MPKYIPRPDMMEGNKSKDGTVALSYPMLSKSNYTAWSLKMKVNMQAHGIWEAVELADPKVAAGEKKDRLALAAIYQSIPEDILLSVADKKTVKEAWDAIKTMCLGADSVRQANVHTLKSEFEVLSMKETETIDEFCMTLKVW